MKKKLFVLIFIIFCLFLSSCKKEEYGVIELSGGELTEFLFNEENTSYSIIFALYTPESEKGEEFKEALEKATRRTKTIVYLVDYSHIDFMSAFLIDDLALGDNCYYVYQDGTAIVSEEYKDYDTLYKNINGKKFYPDIVYNTQEYIDEQIEFAKEEYDEGRITTSLNYLFLIWNSKEAQDFYEDHENYKIVHYWEGYIPTGDNENMHYFGFSVGLFFNTLTIYDKMDKVEGFEKPTEGKMYFYYYKDGYFYISEKEEGTYKKGYKVEKMTDDRLYVKLDDLTLGMYYVY